MDFSQLLSLAKQNDHAAKDQLKNSKAPNLEFKAPAKVVKPQRDIEAIKARLQAHQERLKREEQAKEKVKLPSQPKPAHNFSKPLSVRPQGTGTTKPVQNASARPAASLPQKAPSSRPAHPKPCAATSVVKKDESKTSLPNGKVQQPAPNKPAASSSSKPVAKPSDVRRPSAPSAVQTKQKPKPLPPPPTLSFQQMLRLAAQQSSTSVPDDVPLGIPLKPAGRSQLGVAQSSKPADPPPRNPVQPRKSASTSAAPARKPTSSREQKPAERKPTRPDVVKKAPEPAPRPSGSKPPPPRLHMNDDRRPSVPQRPGPNNMRTGGSISGAAKNDRAQAISKGADNRTVDPSKRPGVSVPDRSRAGTGPPPRGAVSNGAAKNPPKNGNPQRRIGRELTSSERSAARSVYPERFNPLSSTLKKRPKPSYDEEEDLEDEMDDFIDDTPYDDDMDVSKHIREIFGYDRRRYVGREEDDDDLAHMESDVHQQWKEEAISAYIGRKEDEREEELERQELAREKAMKKAKKMRIS